MLPVVTGEFRLVDDPELRFSPSGVAVGSARLVANSRKKVNDEWVDDKVVWLRLTAFKKLAENLAESFTKGDLIEVSGKLQTEEYETREGEKRQSYTVIADRLAVPIVFNPARPMKADRPAASAPSSPAEDPWASAAPSQSDDPPF